MSIIPISAQSKTLNIMNKISSIYILLLLVVMSCKETKESPDPTPSLGVGVNAVSFEHQGGSKNIEVKSSSEGWSVDVNFPEWIVVEKTDNQTVKISVGTHSGEVTREGSVTLTLGNLKQVVKIVQEPLYYLSMESKEIKFDDVDTPATIKYRSNVKEPDILEKPEWLSLIWSEGELSVKAEDNPIETERKGKIILEAKGIRTTIDVSQAPKAYVRLLDEPKVFHYRGGEQVLRFETNRKGQIEAKLKIPSDYFLVKIIDENKLHTFCPKTKWTKRNERALHFVYKERVILVVKFAQAESTLAQDLKTYLIKFYHSTNGENWKNNTNWLSDKPLSEWYGVSVRGKDPKNGLFSLKLPNNNLKGRIPEGFSIFEDAVFIYLQDNALEGPIPQEINKMERSLFLNLSHNNLTGSIPIGLDELPGAQWYDFRWNRLTGILPDCFKTNASFKALPQQDGYKFDNQPE